MRFTVIQANMVTDDFEWHLHKAGCRDLAANKYVMSEQFIVEADTGAIAADEFIDDEMIEMGWTTEDIRVFNCATRPFG